MKHTHTCVRVCMVVTTFTISPFSFQVRDPLAYRLIFRSPDGCAPSQCDIFIGIDTNTGNSGYLDIYMEASTTGWVAVGFSDTRTMVRISNTTYPRSRNIIRFYSHECSLLLMSSVATGIQTTITWLKLLIHGTNQMLG